MTIPPAIRPAQLQMGQNDYGLPGAHHQADRIPGDFPELVGEALHGPPRPIRGGMPGLQNMGLWGRCLQGRTDNPAGIWLRTRIQAGTPERHPAMHAYGDAHHQQAPRHAPRGERRARLEGASHRVVATCPWGRMSAKEKGHEVGRRVQTRC